MPLSDIIGQEKAITILRGILTRKKIATSYLFAGENGIGKKTTALNFIKSVFCETPKNNMDSCEECQSCSKINSGNHPDFIIVSPEDGIIKTEDIKRVEKALSTKPFESRGTMVLIDEAETMNTTASNAFLKTLEEPPLNTMIVLVSSRPDMLPQTIRSRCSVVNFVPLSDNDCKKVVEEKTKEDSPSAIIKLSQGRPGIALKPKIQKEREQFLSSFKDALSGGKTTWSTREDVEKWLDSTMMLLRDVIVINTTKDMDKIINIDMKDYIIELSKKTDPAKTIDIYMEINKIRNLMIFNLNKTITWNYLSLLLQKHFMIKYR